MNAEKSRKSAAKLAVKLAKRQRGPFDVQQLVRDAATLHHFIYSGTVPEKKDE